MLIPLVVTKRHKGQRVTSWWQLATRTNRDPNRYKNLAGPTNHKHRKLIGVKTMSLGTNYIFYCLECYQYFRIEITSYIVDSLMCCPTNKVIKSYTKRFLALGGLHEDQSCDILQAMAPTNVETAHQTSSFHIQSNLDLLGLLSPTHGQRFQ